MGGDQSIGPFQKEHEGVYDDKGKPEIQWFARAPTRNTEDIVEASKNQADVAAELVKDTYDPWGPNVRTSTETSPAPPAVSLSRPEGADVRASDIVGTTLVVA